MRQQFSAKLLKLAIPALMMESEDFALSNAEHNFAMSKLCRMRKRQDLTELNPDPSGHDLFMGGDWDEGFVTLIDKETGLIGFFVRFEQTDYGVVQTSLWNSAIDLTNKGLPAKVFWFLFEHYGSVCSDALHTQHGRGFWIRRMQEADQRGLKIGLLNELAGETVWKDQPLQQWLTEQNAWGPDRYHLRFIITQR